MGLPGEFLDRWNGSYELDNLPDSKPTALKHTRYKVFHLLPTVHKLNNHNPAMLISEQHSLSLSILTVIFQVNLG